MASVQMVAAEDTRRTRVLLEEIGARPDTLLALHEHNEALALNDVIEALQAGADVALVSDAGTPLLSDPGFELVRRCWELGIRVLPVPGPSALAAALSVCPLPSPRFYFHGFLAARDAQRRRQLGTLLRREEAVVFFETPHRIERCLEEIAEMAPARRLMVGREMTKRHEDYLLGDARTLVTRLRDAHALRGEFVCVLEAAEPGLGLEANRTMAALVEYLSPSQAAKVGAQLLGVNRRDLYELATQLASQRR